MTTTQSAYTPQARLVLFRVCLAIAGSVIAGAHYYAGDLSQQMAVKAPQNTDEDGCENCVKMCVIMGSTKDNCVKGICKGSCG